MKQLPESVKPNMSKSIWKVIIPIMFGSVVFVVIRFFIYCPNAKDTGIIAVMACIMHGLCSAITTIVLPVLNRLDSQKQTKIYIWFVTNQELIIRVVRFVCAVLCIIFIVCFLYILPRSLPPKIIDVTNESHNITEADPTDIKIIVETNLTVETVYFDDNEVRKAWTNDYERKGMKHIFSTVLVFDEEDNSDHTITVSIRASNGSERVQETSFKYNPGDYRESKTVSVTLSPTSTLTPTPTPTIEGSDGELEIVCIPAKNLGTEEELHEFYNHIDSASSAALVRLYSEIMSPELDACFVLTTEKELTGIVLNAVSETTIYPPCYMKKINEGVWYFDADFIENSMFEIAVTAYAKDGMVYREKIHLKFPFE